MPNPLLSSYRAGENRVTSSTMAVFERIDLALVQEVLAAATGAGAELGWTLSQRYTRLDKLSSGVTATNEP